jgi:alpha-amylase
MLVTHHTSITMAGFFESLRKSWHGTRPTQDIYTSLQNSVLEWLGLRTKERDEAGVEVNGVIFQAFHWYLRADAKHWNKLTEVVGFLAERGITALWLPPAYKGAGGINDVGYGVYDLYDLGEFNQKGSIPTKYGSKADYEKLLKTCTKAGLHVYADVVFNHKLGGDAEEEFEAVPVNWNNRNEEIGPPEKIKSFTRFDFAGRAGKYSQQKYHWYHFDAVDFNSINPGDKRLFRMKDKSFADKVELENGNFDYLMGCDLDVDHPEVKADLLKWGEWMLDEFGIDGFRLDALKHIQGDFFHEWHAALEKKLGRPIFAVGEYWSTNIDALNWYIANTEGRLSLFDVGLHFQFAAAGNQGRSFDLRNIFNGTLVQRIPILAVTFVDNHDTQPFTSLQSTVADWFKPLAYALILLRRDGYPCVFHPDYFGAEYENNGQKAKIASHQFLIDKFLYARRDFAYGLQKNYLDHPNCIGWTRLGSEAHPGGLAVLLCNGDDGYKWMDVGHPNSTYIDITEHIKESVVTNNDGWGEFRCPGGKVSVWIPKRT